MLRLFKTTSPQKLFPSTAPNILVHNFTFFPGNKNLWKPNLPIYKGSRILSFFNGSDSLTTTAPLNGSRNLAVGKKSYFFLIAFTPHLKKSFFAISLSK